MEPVQSLLVGLVQSLLVELLQSVKIVVAAESAGRVPPLTSTLPGSSLLLYYSSCDYFTGPYGAVP